MLRPSNYPRDTDRSNVKKVRRNENRKRNKYLIITSISYLLAQNIGDDTVIILSRRQRGSTALALSFFSPKALLSSFWITSRYKNCFFFSRLLAVRFRLFFFFFLSPSARKVFIGPHYYFFVRTRVLPPTRSRRRTSEQAARQDTVTADGDLLSNTDLSAASARPIYLVTTRDFSSSKLPLSPSYIIQSPETTTTSLVQSCIIIYCFVRFFFQNEMFYSFSCGTQD